ncbi:MAG: hypothetical protein JSS36_09415 [Proteobacteria bacterium]|nr:hypothetical protein [Pseudomonadota bacterium]
MAEPAPAPEPTSAPAAPPSAAAPLAGIAHRDGVAFAFTLRDTPRRRWHPEHGVALALWLATLALGAWRLL